MDSIVAKHEVVIWSNPGPRLGLVAARSGVDVRLVQGPLGASRKGREGFALSLERGTTRLGFAAFSTPSERSGPQPAPVEYRTHGSR